MKKEPGCCPASFFVFGAEGAESALWRWEAYIPASVLPRAPPSNKSPAQNGDFPHDGREQQ